MLESTVLILTFCFIGSAWAWLNDQMAIYVAWLNDQMAIYVLEWITRDEIHCKFDVVATVPN